MPSGRLLLIDVSNSFTKFALSTTTKMGKVHRLATPTLAPGSVLATGGGTPLDAIVLSSVVPHQTRRLRRAIRDTPVIEVGADTDLGVGIDYPHPETIGADRLADAVGAVALFGAPCIVIDFGTAVTFDVVARDRGYIGGVIAPGLSAMTDYLHDRTALLPKIEIEEPVAVVGKSTRAAMLSGAVYGYRGLIRGILGDVRRASFPRQRCRVVATGGDAPVIAAGMREIHAIHPTLTLEGLRMIGVRWLAAREKEAGTGRSGGA